MAFLGSLGKALGGAIKGFVTGGPIGAITGGVGALVPKRTGAGTGLVQQYPSPIVRSPFEFGPLKVGTPRAFYPQIGPPVGDVPTGQIPMMVSPDGRICPIPGQRYNKSTYVIRGGGTSRWSRVPLGTPQVIPKGTVCVTKRTINAGNGRAATRALVRLAAFDRLATRVDKQLKRIAGTRRGGRGRQSRCTCAKNPCTCR